MRTSAVTATALTALALLLAGCAGGTAPSDDMDEPKSTCSPSDSMHETEKPMDDESMDESEAPMDDESMDESEAPMDDESMTETEKPMDDESDCM